MRMRAVRACVLSLLRGRGEAHIGVRAADLQRGSSSRRPWCGMVEAGSVLGFGRLPRVR